MILESIRSLLGAELTAQVENALKGKGKDGKDVDLVVGNDGSFVPADKYEGEKRRAASAENALKKAAEAVKDLGGSGDPAKLEEDAGKAKTTIETLKSDHKREIAGIRRDTCISCGEAHVGARRQGRGSQKDAGISQCLWVCAGR